ncbi:MAG TPA: hypothetical protein VLZ75_02690 [Chitinophagales bacterium]|nr:hypothetical protein [Chitinophagales bacterium]
MQNKWKNILFKIFLLITFGSFVVLSIMSFQYGQPISNANAQIDINYENGHLFINEEIINGKIHEFFSDTTKVDATSLSRLEKFLQGHPHVKYANAYIDSRGNLHVSVDQVNPIARVLPKGGNSYYVDEHQNKVPTSNLYTAKVPVLTGYIPEEYHQVEPISSWELKALIKVINETKEDPYWSAQIAQLLMSESEEIKMIPRLGNQIVTLGDSTDILEKLKRLDAFYSEISKTVGWDAFKYIDVQYKNQIVCK